MSIDAALLREDTPRIATRRRYLMCRPTHYEVTYAINPWMDPAVAVDRGLALRQWENLRQIYRDLVHEVSVIEGRPGLPDMVFAANGGLVVDGRAYGASFAHEQRRAEGPAYQSWFAAEVAAGRLEAAVGLGHTNEGEGDFLVAGGTILAGHGFRTDRAAHAELAALCGWPVLSLELVNPRYYHLDTALAVLDDDTVAYFPGAFSEESLQALRRRFPGAIEATAEDAAVLGLNAVSDGRNVVLSDRAARLMGQIRERGFHPVGVDLSEFAKAGGSVKCCTAELRG